MTVYLVTVESSVKADKFDYNPFFQELANSGAHRAMVDCWFVESPSSSRSLHDHLKTFILEQDRLIVSKMTQNTFFSQVGAGTNTWLNQRAIGD